MYVLMQYHLQSIHEVSSYELYLQLIHCFCSNKKENAEQMLYMKLVSLLLFHLHNQKLSHLTIKSICNVLSALLGSSPGMEDVRR